MRVTIVKYYHMSQLNLSGESGEIAGNTIPPQLADNVPIVSMDIKLGQRYEYVDFDYAAYEEFAAKVGVPDNLQIHFEPGSRRREGVYGATAKSVTISSRKDPNGALKHELKHAADDEDYLLKDNARNVIGKLGMLGLRVSNPLGVAEVALLIGGKISPNQFAAAYFSMLISSATAAAWGYLRHPDEVRARKTAKDMPQTIVEFSPRES